MQVSLLLSLSLSLTVPWSCPSLSRSVSHCGVRQVPADDMKKVSSGSRLGSRWPGKLSPLSLSVFPSPCFCSCNSPFLSLPPCCPCSLPPCCPCFLPPVDLWVPVPVPAPCLSLSRVFMILCIPTSACVFSSRELRSPCPSALACLPAAAGTAADRCRGVEARPAPIALQSPAARVLEGRDWKAAAGGRRAAEEEGAQCWGLPGCRRTPD